MTLYMPIPSTCSSVYREIIHGHFDWCIPSTCSPNDYSTCTSYRIYLFIYSILKLCWVPQLNSDSRCLRAQSVLNEGKWYGPSLEELPSLCLRWGIRSLIHWPYSPRDAGYINFVNVSPFRVGDTGKLDFLSAHFL